MQAAKKLAEFAPDIPPDIEPWSLRGWRGGLEEHLPIPALVLFAVQHILAYPQLDPGEKERGRRVGSHSSSRWFALQACGKGGGQFVRRAEEAGDTGESSRNLLAAHDGRNVLKIFE